MTFPFSVMVLKKKKLKKNNNYIVLERLESKTGNNAAL